MIFSTKLNAFEGPMDLLMHLIEKNKIDIYNIPIAEITDQYLEYLNNMEEEDIDVMSEFLVMAATLLDIKSRMLLPKETDEDGSEEDPRAELVQRLLEYKLYKYMSSELKERAIDEQKAVYKEESLPKTVKEYKAPIDMDYFLGDITVSKMKEIFADVMARCQRSDKETVTEHGSVKREEVNIGDRITYIRERICECGSMSFRKLLSSKCSKLHLIITFMAVLELMKAGEINAVQDDTYADIILSKTEQGDAEE